MKTNFLHTNLLSFVLFVISAWDVDVIISYLIDKLSHDDKIFISMCVRLKALSGLPRSSEVVLFGRRTFADVKKGIEDDETDSYQCTHWEESGLKGVMFNEHLLIIFQFMYALNVHCFAINKHSIVSFSSHLQHIQLIILVTNFVFFYLQKFKQQKRWNGCEKLDSHNILKCTKVSWFY